MAAPPMPPGREVQFIQALPDELGVRILNNLDYPDLINLAAVDRYHRQFVDPQACPVDDKIAFVKKAQLFKQHNDIILEFAHGPGQKFFLWTTDRFACYSCFCVLDRWMFSRRQTKDKLDKDSPFDGDPGARRFCFLCGIKQQKYRRGTVLKLAYHQQQPLYDRRRKITCAKFKHAFCVDCNIFRCIDDDDLGSWNRCSHDLPRIKVPKPGRDMVTVSRHGETEVMQCHQCNNTTMRLPFVVCSFCGGEVCTQCGVPQHSPTYWWCGRACSQQTLQLMLDCENGILPLHPLPRAIGLLDCKRNDRAARAAAEHDVLDQDGGEDSMLDMLYSITLRS